MHAQGGQRQVQVLGALGQVFGTVGQMAEQIGVEAYPQCPILLPQTEHQQPAAADQAPQSRAGHQVLAQAEQGAEQGQTGGQSIQ
ncbi:hypothetical protein D3C72_1988640 [compost metagenome]